MAIFKNTITGNIVKSNDPVSIELMRTSDIYVPYTPKKPAVKTATKGKPKGKK